MGGVTNFLSVVETRSLGTADIDKMSAAIDKQSFALENLGKKATAVNEHPGFSAFAEKIKQGIENPLQAVASAAEAALNALGPIGVGVAAAAGTFAAFGVAAFEAARGLGEYSTQIQNVAIRTGLSAKEVGQFSFAAKTAGQDVSVFETAMRKLSQGLADSSSVGDKARDGLADLGVSAYDSTGKLKAMSDIFVQISSGLSKIEDPAKRDIEALKIFGRSGVELLPTLIGLNENFVRARALGFGTSDADIKRWQDYQKAIVEIDTRWDQLVRKFKDPLAATIVFSFKAISSPVFAVVASALGIPGFSQGGDQSSNPIDREYAETQGYGYGAADSLGLHRSVATSVARASQAIGADRYSFGNTLLGAQYEEGKAKEAAEKLRTEYFSLAGSADEATVSKKRREWQDAETALRSLSEQVKLLAKDEATRLNIIEKTNAMLREGKTFYQIGTGLNTTFITGDQLATANAPTRNPPSLFGRRNPFNDVQYAKDILSAPDFAQGLQVVNGEAVFVSPSSTRTDEAGANAQRLFGGGSLDRDRENQQINISAANARAGFQSRILEIQGRPGEEIKIAQQVAAIRDAALRQEFSMTGDIAKYREASLQNELDLSTKIAEVEEQRKRAFESGAVGLFNAAISGNVPGFLKSQGLGLADKVVGNAAGTAWKSISGLIPHAASGPLGDLLQGTPFGPDPLKAATDLNTAATIANTAALRSMALSASGGGGSAGGGSLLKKFGILDNYGSGGLRGTDIEGGWGGGGSNSSGEADGPDGSGLPTDGSPGDWAGEASGSGWSSAARGVGIAGAGIAAGFGAYSGFKHGGAQGALTGVGSLAGGAGAILGLAGVSGPAAPILAGVGLALGIFSTLLGDPKQRREAQIGSQLERTQYLSPVSINASMTTGGGYADFDRFGGTRGSNLSPYPSLEQGYFDYRRNITVPGRTLSGFGGGAAPAPIIVNVSTMDSRSFNDNSHLVAGAVEHALATGKAAGLQETLRSM